MSLIRDVAGELRAVSTSTQSLKKFGLLVGSMFLLIGLYMNGKANLFLTYVVLIVPGGLLIISGCFAPRFLRFPYKVWMALSFSLGWVVSRVILMILFYIVVAPVGLVTRLAGKDFMGLRRNVAGASFWIRKDRNRLANYEKMY